MDGFEPAAIDMRVALGRGDIRVAQQFLHRPQIRAVSQQMRGKCVSERVG